MLDLKKLLELIHTTSDINVQMKLFSTLSACIISKDVKIDIIITYNPLYDQVCYMLSNCPLNKATVMFNFLSALVYSVEEDNERRKTLILYAKNMIRSSGCLATMCELFRSCMMHQDVWRSLCQCLAETCRGVEANQSYCTHLVPMCIQRSNGRNIEILPVLQSLLQNHKQNINLFIECNGISIFERELLQHDVCLQLLNTVVQSSTEGVKLITNTEICQYLRNFLRLYGPESQLGKWTTVILYHITGQKGPYEDNTPENPIGDSNKANAYDMQDTTNATQFIQNVMKEIIRCTPISDLKYLQETNFQKNDIFSNKESTRNKIKLKDIHYFKDDVQNEDISKSEKCDLSFLFLETQNSKKSINLTMKRVPLHNIPASFQRTPPHKMIIAEMSSGWCESFTKKNISPRKALDLNDFKPKFASTPIKHKINQLNGPKREYVQNIRRDTSTSVSFVRQKINRKIKKIKQSSNSIRTSSFHEKTTMDKENRHRSISGRFFEAINESCTAFVKTMKNIFKTKNTLEDAKEKCSNRKSAKDTSCSYSFTNYMKKRDAILNNECTINYKDDFEDFSIISMSNSCNTCNDTLALKHKLKNDKYLKQTVRKLKLGINLYGCDFRKISNQLWPQQTYMTPVVLYNLYRKLIIK